MGKLRVNKGGVCEGSPGSAHHLHRKYRPSDTMNDRKEKKNLFKSWAL